MKNLTGKLAACCAALLSIGASGAPLRSGAAGQAAAANAGRKPLRVLMIGNSFSRPCVNNLPPVARSLGVELDIASLYIGGCPLERHWNNVCAGVTNAAFRPYRFDRNTCGKTIVEDGRAGIPDALAAAQWDVVTIQQASHESWRPASYSPAGERLIDFIRQRAPGAEIVVQETWSYSPSDKRLAKWNISQDEMHSRLHDAYAAFAQRNNLRIIPVGEAVRQWRERLPVDYTKNDFGGDVVGRKKPRLDTFHLNPRGEYLQALVWARTLFPGIDVRKCAYRPECVSPADAALMREIAAEAGK